MGRQGPDRPALYTAYGDRTFGELNANINRLVRALRARGLRPGDSVALMCTNRPEFLEVLYAAAAQRAAPHPDQLAPHRGRSRLHRGDCEAKAFVADRRIG